MPFHIIFASWLAFLLYWIANARRVKTPAITQSFRSRLAHRLPVSIGIVLLFVTSRRRDIPYLLPPTALTAWTGAALAVLGLAIAIWARRTIASNWSSDVEFKQDHTLVTHGPYAWVRHPIYTALLIMCLGTAIASGRLISFLALPLILLGFWIKLRQEERLMRLHFPTEYPAYERRVKALIPGIL